jgi:hypothetical protein
MILPDKNRIMHESRLEQNGGHRYLVVWYDKEKVDFNEAIKVALLKHKLEPGECPVLCLPSKGGD